MKLCTADCQKKLTKSLVAILLLFSQLAILPFYARGQNSPSPLKGSTRKVLAIPNTTIDAGFVLLSEDSDNDGMPDDEEIRNGLDPRNGSDADGDRDGDGVSNGDEIAGGTNPNALDSDNDGASDAEEIRLGYDPLDPNSTPPANTTIVSLTVAPANLALTVNTIFGAEPVQLTVTGVTNTGTIVDLTNDPNTVYQSLNQAVAAVDSTGKVYGLSGGATGIRVQNRTLTAETTVNVGVFEPSAVAGLYLPGAANSIKVSGNYAFVAAGEAGLHVVEVTNRNNPVIVATLDTPGNANDLRISGNFLYLADGVAGLRIIDITAPTSPVSVGSVNTPGSANELVVVGNRAFVADLESGLQIIDVANPAAPQIIGSLATAGKARGVDVAGNYAIVAQGSSGQGGGGNTFAGNPQTENLTFNGVSVIDISTPANPVMRGSVSLLSDALDVSVRGNLAYIAGWLNGFQVVNFANPANPTIVASETNNFQPRDLALVGDYLMAAETFQVNFVPFFKIDLPPALNYRGGLDLSSQGSMPGTGIAADSQFVYRVGNFSAFEADKGTSGFSMLHIGRYRVPSSDSGGVAPTVSLISPVEGDSVREGKTLQLSADASDDVFVAGVQFKVNGNVVATVSNAPYEFSYQAPLNLTTLAVTATAFDLGGNTRTTAPVAVVVEPDLPPSINLVSPAAGTIPVQGETVRLAATATDDEDITNVTFKANGAVVASVDTAPFEAQFTVPENIVSLTIEAVATDTVGRTAAATRVLNVIPDPLTTVTGRVVTPSGQPISGATVSTFSVHQAQTNASGVFSIPNVPTARGNIVVRASAVFGAETAANLSAPFVPVRGATTNIGDLVLSPAVTSPTFVADGRFGTRDEEQFSGADLFVTYPYRESKVFSFNGTEFVPRAVEGIEIGSVKSGLGGVSVFGSYYQNRIFAQSTGQSGTVNQFLVDYFDNHIVRSTFESGLNKESEDIAVGYDYSYDRINSAFLANDDQGASVAMRVGTGNQPISIPVPANSRLHSLELYDIDSNGYTDMMALGEVNGAAAKLLVVRRTGNDSFADPVVSDVIERDLSGSDRQNNLIVGGFVNPNGRDIAILGNDRVRIYATDPEGSGAFTLAREVVLPAGQTPTGITIKNLGYIPPPSLTSENKAKADKQDAKSNTEGIISSGFGFASLMITTRSLTEPSARKLLIYTNNSGNFSLTTERSYTLSSSQGDAQIIISNWGGDFRQDVAIVDGDRVLLFIDLIQPASVPD